MRNVFCDLVTSEEIFDNNKMTMYGLSVYFEFTQGSTNGKFCKTIENISISLPKVLNLKTLIEKHQLSSVHLSDFIEDFLG